MSKDFKWNISKRLGIIADHPNSDWKKELNALSWNEGPVKLDIRSWSTDHTKMTRGITFEGPELKKICELYDSNIFEKILKDYNKSLNDDDAKSLTQEITFAILHDFGVINTTSSGWALKFRIISWNGGRPKCDLRKWDPYDNRMERGITLTQEEMEKVVEAYQEHKDDWYMRNKEA